MTNSLISVCDKWDGSNKDGSSKTERHLTKNKLFQVLGKNSNNDID